MDNAFKLVQQALVYVLPHLPAAYVAGITSFLSFIVSTCVFIRFVWAKCFKPPTAGTKKAFVFNLITKLAGLSGFNAPAYGPGYKSIKVGVGTDREEAEKALGLQPGSSTPQTLKPPASVQ